MTYPGKLRQKMQYPDKSYAWAYKFDFAGQRQGEIPYFAVNGEEFSLAPGHLALIQSMPGARIERDVAQRDSTIVYDTVVRAQGYLVIDPLNVKPTYVSSVTGLTAHGLENAK